MKNSESVSMAETLTPVYVLEMNPSIGLVGLYGSEDDAQKAAVHFAQHPLEWRLGGLDGDLIAMDEPDNLSASPIWVVSRHSVADRFDRQIDPMRNSWRERRRAEGSQEVR
jgi:hypothetical protein